ncbi:MAG: DUF952 domain-containing protein [Acidobacteriota bacterium]|nr:MAG: DUF952 domain-containing protein [Acidobacteriota bacterium]
MNVYHITTTKAWEAAEDPGGYRAASLESEGFIHCSFKDQLSGVLERYYRGAGELLVLEIDPARLRAEMKTEPSTGGEDYPHIYGPINKDAVIGTAAVAAPA